MTDLWLGDSLKPWTEGLHFYALVSPATIGGQVISVSYESISAEGPDMQSMIAARNAVYGPGKTTETGERMTTTWHVSTDRTPFDAFDYRCASLDMAMMIMTDDPAPLFDAGCAIFHTMNAQEKDGLFTVTEYLSMSALALAESIELSESLK